MEPFAKDEKNNVKQQRRAKPISNNLLNTDSVPPSSGQICACWETGKTGDEIRNHWAHLWSRWLRWTRSWCPPCGCPPLGCTYTGRLLRSGWDNLKTHSAKQRCPCHPTCPFWTRERHCRETGREGSPRVRPVRKYQHTIQEKCTYFTCLLWK